MTRRRDYYAPGGLNGRIILDPMIGGGTTLHEALRMGANVIGVDLDPIPILQARATLTTYPLVHLEAGFYSAGIGSARGTGATLPHDPVPTARRNGKLVSSCMVRGAPAPAVRVLVVDSLVLRQESDGTLVRLCPHCKESGARCRTLPCAASRRAAQIVERGRCRLSGCAMNHMSRDLAASLLRSALSRWP